MTRWWAVAKFLLIAFVCYLVFGTSGQLSGLWLMGLVGDNEALGWVMYGTGIVVSVCVPVGVWMWLRSGRSISTFTRPCLAGFAAFFCWQWTVAGTPDWNPVPLLIGLLTCSAAAVAVLIITAGTREGSTSPD